LHPEIQSAGPLKFDIRCIERHVIDKQKNSQWLRGGDIYKYHVENGMLEKDFGLRELQALKLRREAFFKKYLSDLLVMGWRSVVKDLGDDIYVPFLCLRNRSQSLILDWCWIGNGHVHVKGVALRYP
jgi:hypothetical protein